jgi:hypothetical protein
VSSIFDFEGSLSLSELVGAKPKIEDTTPTGLTTGLVFCYTLEYQ